jgi:hypothetical protein
LQLSLGLIAVQLSAAHLHSAPSLAFYLGRHSSGGVIVALLGLDSINL